MKRKLYLTALVMCMALAVNGCGSDKETTSTESESTATEQQAEDSAEEEEVQEPYTDSTGATRLVSVDNVEKYVTIADYKGITLDNSVPEVTDEDIENRIAENLKDNSVEVTDENAVIQNGDTATINFVGTKDGEAFEGGTGNNYDLVIGSGTMIPGFEEGIVGMQRIPITRQLMNIRLLFAHSWSRKHRIRPTAVCAALHGILFTPILRLWNIQRKT